MKFKFAMFLIASLTACGELDSSPTLNTTTYGTQVSGFAFLTAPLADAHVEIYQLPAGKQPKALKGITKTDSQGAYQVKASTLFGPTMVCVKHASFDGELCAVARNLPQYGTAAPIIVTPITHLAAGYARYLLQSGETGDTAVKNAFEQINAHFGNVPHQEVVPWQPDPQVAGPQDVPLQAATTAYLYLQGLEELARWLSSKAHLKNDTAITLATLTQALHLDISSNGIFDGKEENAQLLFLRDQPLSDQTLRSHLASALERFIVSDKNATQMGVHEISTLLTRTADSELAIFGNYPSTRYLASLPKFASCSVLTQERQKSLLAYPQRGTIELLCQWECTTQLRLVGLGFVASPAVALESAHMDDNTVVHAVINTKSLSIFEDRKVGHRLLMKVENSLGSTAEADIDIKVENSPPQVSLSTMPSRLAGGKSLMVSGTSDRSIKTVTLSDGLGDLSSEDSEEVFCKEEFDFYSNARSFQLNYMSDEEKVYDLWLKVVDWAGNSTSQKISYARDSTPPLLHLHNGLFGSHRSPKRTAEQNENRPITIHRRLNALDEGTEDISSAQQSEIPEIQFHVSDPGRETSSFIRVEYKYSMGEQERYEKEWTILIPDKNNAYSLKLSYQNLLKSEILRQGPASAIQLNHFLKISPGQSHKVEIKLTDEAGNSSLYEFPFFLDLHAPPIQWSNCAPTGSLLGANLGNTSMKDVFTAGFDLFAGQIIYPLNRGEGSVIPQGKVRITLKNGGLISKIFAVHRANEETGRSDVPSERRTKLQDAIEKSKACANYKGPRSVWEGYLCFKSKKPAVYPVSDRMSANIETDTPVRYRLFRPDGVQALQLGESEFEIESDISYTVMAQTAGPSSSSTGEPLDWGQLRVMPNGVHGLELEHLFGLEIQDGHFGREYKFLRQSKYVSGMTMTVRPPHIAIVADAEAQALGLTIEAAPSCQSESTVTFTNDKFGIETTVGLPSHPN